jgi:predicted ATPase
MITSLTVKNFKCFRESSEFAFTKLNLLTGINGRGKSSLLHALLIIAQSAGSNNLKTLTINGEKINLGNFYDICNSETLKQDSIHFRFQSDNPEYPDIELEYEEDANEPFQVTRRKATKTNTNESIIAFANAIRKTHFISADRRGPVQYVDKLRLPDFVHVGPRGENTVNILANSHNIDNVNKLLYRGENAASVIQQTADWLDYILDGAYVDIRGKEQESSVLYMLLNNKNNSYKYKPVNVGFGYSYILPLIVTGLIAKPGEIVIIENPEAHLHPRAQSRMSEFFARVASYGIQVFIESHSEHILNGLRVNILKDDISVSNDDLTIFFFDENFASEKLIVNDKGKIENWPAGFFDQDELDLADIFRLGRAKA